MKLPKLFKLDRYEFIGAAVAISVVGPIAWWALDRTPVMDIAEASAPVAPVERGGALRPRYVGAFYRRCSGSSRRVFVDATKHSTWTNPYNFRDGIDADGKPVILQRRQVLPPTSVPVPYAVAPGPTTYQTVIHFYCNPLQKALGRDLPWLSIPFVSPEVKFTVAGSTAPVVAPSIPMFAPVADDVQPAPPPDGAR